MRKLVLFISVVVILMAGWILYLNQEKKNFIENLLPSPAVVNQPINKSSSSVNEKEDSNDFVEGRIVKPDGERFIPDDRVHESLPQEQTTSSEKPTPDEKADFVHSQWIQMFGDIPQVHVASEYARKIYKKERMTIDEQIAGLEASHYLFPYGGHGLMLEMFKTMKAQGIDEEDIEIMYEEDIENVRYAPNHKEIHLGDVPAYLRSNPPAPDSISSESIDEDTVTPPARSQMLPVTSEPHAPETPGHVHAPPTIPLSVPPAAAKSVESSGWEGLLPEQREQAKELFDQYGTEEGLRRLKEMDPDTAERFEREWRGAPSRSSPSSEDYSDDQPSDDSP